MPVHIIIALAFVFAFGAVLVGLRRLPGLLAAMQPSVGVGRAVVMEREDRRVPEAVARRLRALEAELTAAGLRPIGWTRSDAAGMLRIFNAVATDDVETVAFGAVIQIRGGGGSRIVSQQVEYVTRLEPGESLHTNNGLQQLPEIRGMDMLQYPECRDAASLLLIHHARVRASGRVPLPAAMDLSGLETAARQDDDARAGAAPEFFAYQNTKRDRSGRIVERDEAARAALASLGLEDLWRTP